ncbi:peptidoglycan-binding domain-containing protein [Streptomyces sp. NRRL S-350]|uniref:peptidoglycan-binding domain-containing protein n=1 Tax=Streptomyces sp. NRRL S-350 TaxID=1463902 RepID=UPI00068FF7B0|nr:peptidoglycan-binding domain-containing protein [Streptomyces sp. NRRL S-350]
MAAGVTLSLSVVIGLSGTAQASHTAPYVQEGSRGTAVSCVQAFLNSVGLGHRIAADGVFGPDTKSMVEDFQRAYGNGLSIDGVVGPRTGTALWNMYWHANPLGVMDYCYEYIPTTP